MTKLNKPRKMSKIEQKKQKDLDRAQKDAAKLKKTAATTLRWMDDLRIEVRDDFDVIIIEKGGKTYYVRGIKLTPHNIFIDTDMEQLQMIENLRTALNQMHVDAWYEFVQSPVNCDNWINDLNDEEAGELDPVCHRMIHDDLSKIYDFQATHREKEFMIMIRDSDEKRLQKNMQDMMRLWTNAGFAPKQLTQRDFYSFVSYYYENSLINDYTFTRGIFSYLNMAMAYNAAYDQYERIDHTENFAKYGNEVLNVLPADNMIQKSKIAPAGLSVKSSYIILGDKYISSLLVTKLPPQYGLGMLSEYLSRPSIKLFMKTEQTNENMSRMLNKDYQESLRRLEKSHDETEKKRLATELESQRAYIDDVVRKNDRTSNVILVFQITGDSLEEMLEEKNRLKGVLQTNGFMVNSGLFVQEKLFKLVSPLFINDGLLNTVRANYGVPLTSESFAGLYPFIFESLNDHKGYLIGEELQNGGKIFLDPLYYIHEKEAAARTSRVNGNFVIMGRSGSGKTTAMNLMIRNQIKNKTTIIWVDPENQNRRLTEKYNGTFVDWGKDNNVINIFDLKPVSSDDDTDAHMWDTEAAIRNVIMDVKAVYKLLHPDITGDELSMISHIVEATYQSVGIMPDQDGNWGTFKGMNHDQMPTFKEFDAVLDTAIENSRGKKGYEDVTHILLSLSRKTDPLLHEWAPYFTGHTTIRDNDPSKRTIISFGTKELSNRDENLQNALYYIMFTYAWAKCLNKNVKSAFIIDEAHTLILRHGTARLVSQFVRRSRKYNNITMIGTQNPGDFADPSILTDGKAIFNNSAYKIILGMSHDDVNDLFKLERLNENEALWIETFGQGDALLMLGNDRRIPMHIIATGNELMEISTN